MTTATTRRIQCPLIEGIAMIAGAIPDADGNRLQ